MTTSDVTASGTGRWALQNKQFELHPPRVAKRCWPWLRRTYPHLHRSLCTLSCSIPNQKKYRGSKGIFKSFQTLLLSIVSHRNALAYAQKPGLHPTTSQQPFGGDGFYDHGVRPEENLGVGDAINFVYANRESLRTVPTATPTLTQRRGAPRTPCTEDLRLNFTCAYEQQFH